MRRSSAARHAAWLARRGPDVYAALLRLHRLTLTPGEYPDALPQVSLIDCRGLGDEREKQLLQHLQEEASQLQGSMMLGALFDSCQSWLTDHNCPHGDCAFCLTQLTDSSTTGTCLAQGSRPTTVRSKRLLQ